MNISCITYPKYPYIFKKICRTHFPIKAQTETQYAKYLKVELLQQD